MAKLEIAQRRLHNQLLAHHSSEGPGQVVSGLGAVQSQDFAGAKWAIGQRILGSTDAGIEQAFADGAILRTHILRPTWHFVAPSDIRWMLALTAPRVNALNAHYYRKLGLDSGTFSRSNDLITKALEGGKYLTRPELQSVLQLGGIEAGVPLRNTYLVMRAELDALICSGPRRGKQFTYALLDERAPQARTLDKVEALAELVRRYFTSHGPATLQDFVWWSSLTMAQARTGVEMAGPNLEQAVIDGQTYWFSPDTLTRRRAKDSPPEAHLLPNYDEYISYKDRSAMFDPSNADKMDPESNTVFSHIIIIDGEMVGTWKRTLKKDAVVIETSLFSPLNIDETKALSDAAEHYGRFVGLTAHIA